MKRNRLLALVLLAPLAPGQSCPEPRLGFHADGIAGAATAVARHDDGSGEKRYAGGIDLVCPGAAGVHTVLAWDGASWQRVGGGPPGLVEALISFDDGSGAKLYAGGQFFSGSMAGVARWDGVQWSGVGGGLNGDVIDFAVWDDGNGPALYATGEFTFAGGVAASRVARWDGTSWSPLGAGLNARGRALVAFDDGGGSKLYAGGEFTGAGTTGAAKIARWDGNAWTNLALGLDGAVLDLAVGDENGTPVLYVSGWFTHAVGAVASFGVARWDGNAWSAMPGLMQYSQVFALAVHDDGTGAAVYAGGRIPAQVGPYQVDYVARWSGSSWTNLGYVETNGIEAVRELVEFDDGTGIGLYAVGNFQSIGGVHSEGVARWDATRWSAVGVGAGRPAEIDALATWDDGTGDALYAGGRLHGSIAEPMENLARWDGATWTPLPTAFERFSQVLAMTSFDDGSGSALYVGGTFVSTFGFPRAAIARFDGTIWSPLGTGIDGPGPGTGRVWCIASFDDGSGPALYVGGEFTGAGGILASNVARWDGSTWSALGSGTDDLVRALAVFDDGNGPRLYAGGEFSTAGGVAASRIARWDGSAWTAVGAGIGGSNNFYVATLFPSVDAHGPVLLAGGNFQTAGGISARGVARWTGQSWSALGAGLLGEVNGIVEFDDGSGRGSALYAGGYIFELGFGVRQLARWSGTEWTDLVGSEPGSVRALATYDDGAGARADLYAGGDFRFAGALPASNFAAWRACGETGRTLCSGDGSGTACPCGNASAPGERDGCVNSTGLGGRLRASGRPSLSDDTLVLDGSRMNNGSALYFQGESRVAGGAGAVFGDGLRCAQGNVVRLAILSNAGGASQFPRPGDPSLSAAGALSSPGARVYQVWYRDAQPFCTPSTFDLTNAVEIVWSI